MPVSFFASFPCSSFAALRSYLHMIVWSILMVADSVLPVLVMFRVRYARAESCIILPRSVQLSKCQCLEKSSQHMLPMFNPSLDHWSHFTSYLSNMTRRQHKIFSISSSGSLLNAPTVSNAKVWKCHVKTRSQCLIPLSITEANSHCTSPT